MGSVTLTAHAILTVGDSGMFGGADVTVDANGNLNLGTSSSTGVTIGKAGIPVTVPGSLRVTGGVTASGNLTLTGTLNVSGASVLATTTITNLTVTGACTGCGAGATTPGGSNYQLQFNSSGVFGASPDLTWLSPALTIGQSGTSTGQLKLAGATSGAVTVQASSTAGSWTLTLPSSAGTPGQAMLTDGAGNLYFGSAGSASQWLNGTSGTISYSSGSIGINTTTPVALLSVVGSATSTAPLLDISSSSASSLFRVSSNGTVTIGGTLLVSGLSAPYVTVGQTGTPGTTASVYVVVGTDANGNTRSVVGNTATGPTTPNGTSYNVVSVGAWQSAYPFIPPIGSCNVYRIMGPTPLGKIGSIPSCALGGSLNDVGLSGDGTTQPADTSGAILGDTVFDSSDLTGSGIGLEAWRTQRAGYIYSHAVYDPTGSGVVGTGLFGVQIGGTYHEHYFALENSYNNIDPELRIYNDVADKQVVFYSYYSTNTALRYDMNFNPSGYLYLNPQNPSSYDVRATADVEPYAGKNVNLGESGNPWLAVYGKTLDPEPASTSQNGSIGTVTCSMSLQGVLKVATCYLNGYANTGVAQTYTYPTTFSTTPVLMESSSSCGAYNPTTSATTLTLPANASMNAETCNVVLMGQ
jgi:hypothetical protein